LVRLDLTTSGRRIGCRKQIFGAKQHVPHGARSYQSATGSAAQFSEAANWRDLVAGVSVETGRVMKRCAQCHGRLGLGVRSRNVWNGHWWVHVLYCSTHCEALHELERYNARAKRGRHIITRSSPQAWPPAASRQKGSNPTNSRANMVIAGADPDWPRDRFPLREK
jgi:hypothetical protein